jgi:hypothetical protein
VNDGATVSEGSASYRFGQTGQPGAVCTVDFAPERYWRFILVEAHSFTVATYVSPGSRFNGREWLVNCSSP